MGIDYKEKICHKLKHQDIYVLTNESFHRDNWVKIGYAVDVEDRVKQLSGTAVPLPYEVYCTYEIPRIEGVKDPDKLVHDLIQTLNPNLRITPNREFFEIFPWDAYSMLSAIAQMHGRGDKLVQNAKNAKKDDPQADIEYTVETLFPKGSDKGLLFEKLKGIVSSVEKNPKVNPRKLYVSFKKGKYNVISAWPRAGWIEVVINAKIGEIKDDNDLIYDISNRQWSSEQYAFKFYDDTDEDAVRDLVKQAYGLKK